MDIRPTINMIDMFHGDNREAMPDFVALKAAGIFAISHKASQGTHYQDKRYSERRKAARDAGLLWSAYHFLEASDVADQVSHFMECAEVSSGDPMALECDYERNPPSQAALHQCQDFMSGVDLASPPGVQSILYSGDLIRETLKPQDGGHIADNMKGAQAFFGAHRLWLAEYGPHMNIPWPWNLPDGRGIWAWQFTEKGRVNPIIGNVDGNFYNGTAEQLAANWLS